MHELTPAQKRFGLQIHAFCFAVGILVLAAIDLWTDSSWCVQRVLLYWV